MIPKTAFIIIIAAICIAFLILPVNAAEPNWTANGTGRWEAVDGIYNLIKWNATGNYNWTPSQNVTVEYLVVAGGGGGGEWAGGGGGAGGLLSGNLNVSSLVNISVGTGGTGRQTGGSGSKGGNGTNSTFSSIISLGGGGGGSYHASDNNIKNGTVGGSGGGAGANMGWHGNGTSGQGNNGGDGQTTGWAGGGGGKGETGTSAVGTTAGKGGNGTQNSITGNNTWYAGGGGGCGINGITGDAGLGGGGTGCAANGSGPGVNGTAATGGGGGGGYNIAQGTGGYGGSGVVIIKYATTTVPQTSFTMSSNYNATYPIQVNFTDTTQNNPTTWAWNFGDTYTNSTPNTTHVYTVAGNYIVNLTTSNTGGSNTSLNTFNISSDVDPFVKSWMHFNSSATEDLMGLAWQKTSTANFTTTPTKFGGGSLAIPTKTAYVFTPSSTNLNIGTGAAEIEFWINVTTIPSARNIVSRTSTDGSGTTGGWGFYNGGTTSSYSFWMGSLANNTTAFTISNGVWHHIAVAIPNTSGTINVYQDGVIVATGARPVGSYDVVQPLVIGGGGTAGGTPEYYMDEFRFQIGTPRFTIPVFSPPYAQYRGNLNLSYPNINENATLLYKSYPSPTAAIVYNGSPRYRTPQVTDMTNATSIMFSVNYNPAFERALTPVVNHTSYADINFTLITQDTVNGIERVNVFRDSGLGFTAPNGTRTNLVDLPIDYYNYTTEQNFTMGWGNATITDGQHNITYPITKFLYTPVTYGQWTIYPNFSASATAFPLGNAVTFTDTSLGEPANWTQWNWSFGDGNYSTSQNPTYTYPAAGTYTVTFNSSLIANASVKNSTTRIGYIQVTTAPGSVTNLNGSYVNCTAINFSWTNPTAADFNGTMNWLNNVQQTNLSNTTTSKLFSGLTQNTAYTFSTKTFNNATPPQLNANFINVTRSTPWCTPISNWTGSPTSGNFTFLVQFTDSSYNDPATAWEWNFGDNTTNSTLQNPTHYYTYTGVFSPTLTIQNSSGFKNSLQRINYITSVAGPIVNASDVRNQQSPMIVMFRVTTLWGKELSGATVNIQGITTTAGTWDWVSTLFMVPLDEAPIENTLMSGSTDNYGVAEFMMLPTTKYNITVTYPGYTFPALYVYPHEREYTIVANPLSGETWFTNTSIVAASKTINVTTQYVTASQQSINISYVDTSNTTTGGFVNLTQGNTVILSYPIASSSFWVNQTVTVPMGGTSVGVSAKILTSSGNVNKSYAVSFAGPPVGITGLQPELMMWGAFGLILITGLIATSTSAPMVSVIVVFEAWMFLGIGWLKPLTDRVGLDRVSGLFLVATLIVILWNFRIAKLKETGR